MFSHYANTGYAFKTIIGIFGVSLYRREIFAASVGQPRLDIFSTPLCAVVLIGDRRTKRQVFIKLGVNAVERAVDALS